MTLVRKLQIAIVQYEQERGFGRRLASSIQPEWGYKTLMWQLRQCVFNADQTPVTSDECERRLQQSDIGRWIWFEWLHTGDCQRINKFMVIAPEILAEISFLIESDHENKDNLRWIDELGNLITHGYGKELYKTIQTIKRNGIWQGRHRKIMLEMLLVKNANITEVGKLIINLGTNGFGSGQAANPNAATELVTSLMAGEVWNKNSIQGLIVAICKKNPAIERMAQGLERLKVAELWPASNSIRRQLIFNILLKTSYQGTLTMDAAITLIIKLKSDDLLNEYMQDIERAVTQDVWEAKRILTAVETLEQLNAWPMAYEGRRALFNMLMGLADLAPQFMPCMVAQSENFYFPDIPTPKRELLTETMKALIQTLVGCGLWDKYAQKVSQLLSRNSSHAQEILNGIETLAQKIKGRINKNSWNGIVNIFVMMYSNSVLEDAKLEMDTLSNDLILLFDKLKEYPFTTRYVQDVVEILCRFPSRAKKILIKFDKLEQLNLWPNKHGECQKLFEIIIFQEDDLFEDMLNLIRKLNLSGLWHGHVSHILHFPYQSKRIINDVISLEREKIFLNNSDYNKKLLKILLEKNYANKSPVCFLIELIQKLKKDNLWDENPQSIMSFLEEVGLQSENVLKGTEKLEQASLWSSDQRQMSFQILLAVPDQYETVSTAIIWVFTHLKKGKVHETVESQEYKDEKCDIKEPENKKYWAALLVGFQYGNGKCLAEKLTACSADLLDDVMLTIILLENTYDVTGKVKILMELYPQGMNDKEETELKKRLIERAQATDCLALIQLQCYWQQRLTDEQWQFALQGLETILIEPQVDPLLKAKTLYELAHMHLEDSCLLAFPDEDAKEPPAQQQILDKVQKSILNHELQAYGLFACAAYRGCLDSMSLLNAVTPYLRSHKALELGVRWASKQTTEEQQGLAHYYGGRG